MVFGLADKWTEKYAKNYERFPDGYEPIGECFILRLSAWNPVLEMVQRNIWTARLEYGRA